MTPASLTLSKLLYGHRQPLFLPLSLQGHPGETWAVLGANGLGKSTLLDTITGTLPRLGGSLQVHGGVSLVPQSFQTVFEWSVQDVVLMGRARHVGLFSQPRPADEAQVHQALTQLGISELGKANFTTLSGGQRQLVMIARALVSDSGTVLLDEPCAALDLGNQQVVLQLISDLTRLEQRCVVFTTHDPTHALQVASHTLLLLPEGRWLAGPTADVVTEEHLEQAYGLPVRRLAVAGYPLPVLAPLFRIVR